MKQSHTKGSEDSGNRVCFPLSWSGTIQLDWVAQPTWLCSAATCRRVWSVARAHRSVLPESGGLAARQHGQVARATLIFTEPFRPRRGGRSFPAPPSRKLQIARFGLPD